MSVEKIQQFKVKTKPGKIIITSTRVEGPAEPHYFVVVDKLPEDQRDNQSQIIFTLSPSDAYELGKELQMLTNTQLQKGS